MEPCSELSDPIFDDLSDQYNKLISDIDKLQERYDKFCEDKEQISDELNQLSSDLNNLTESVVESHRMGIIQAEITSEAKNQTTRLIEDLLKEDYVMDILNSKEDFLDIPKEEDTNM